MSSILNQMGSLQGPWGCPWGPWGSLGVSWELPEGSLGVPGGPWRVPRGSLGGAWEVPGDPGKMFGCQDGSQIALMPHLGANLGPTRANMDPTWNQLGSKMGSKIDPKRVTNFNHIFDWFLIDFLIKIWFQNRYFFDIFLMRMVMCWMLKNIEKYWYLWRFVSSWSHPKWSIVWSKFTSTN